jgi:PST family polysaccharide transporter
MVSFPFFSRLQDDPDTGRHAFSRILEQIAFLAFPVFIGIAVCAPQIVEVVFSQKWLPAVPVMRVLATIGLLHSLYYTNNAVFLGYGKPKWRFGLDMLNAVTNFFVFVIAAQWSALAVAWGYVIRGYVLAPVPLIGVKKLLNISLLSYIRNISTPLLAGGIMSGSLLAATHFFSSHLNPAYLLTGQAVFGAMVYFGAVFLISPDIPQRTLRYIGMAFGGTTGTVE